jgi:hypothetical protein
MQREQSLLTFEGDQFMGGTAIVGKYTVSSKSSIPRASIAR